MRFAPNLECRFAYWGQASLLKFGSEILGLLYVGVKFMLYIFLSVYLCSDALASYTLASWAA